MTKDNHCSCSFTFLLYPPHNVLHESRSPFSCLITVFLGKRGNRGGRRVVTSKGLESFQHSDPFCHTPVRSQFSVYHWIHFYKLCIYICYLNKGVIYFSRTSCYSFFGVWVILLPITYTYPLNVFYVYRLFVLSTSWYDH